MQWKAIKRYTDFQFESLPITCDTAISSIPEEASRTSLPVTDHVIRKMVVSKNFQKHFLYKDNSEPHSLFMFCVWNKAS